MRTLASVIAALAVWSCMMTPPSQRGGASSVSMQPSALESTNESSALASEPGHPAPEEPKAPVPTTIEVHSDCPKTVPLFLGEKPKFGSGTKTSIGSNTTTTFARRADGTQTVWIIDDSENGVANAAVSAGTRRLEIGRDCKSIVVR